MVWLTWRQHRVEAAIVAGALALLAAVLVVTGITMRDTYQQLGLAHCLSEVATSPNCGDALGVFRDRYGSWLALAGWLNFIPVLLGILVGAPLVARELEHGTQRLVWTQSVTRGRWLVVTLALVLGGCLVVAVALSLVLTWWLGPWDALNGRFGDAAFDFEAPVLGSYVAFAIVIGMAAGALLRRTVAAMVVTLAGFLAARLPVEFHFRAAYLPPLTRTFDFASPASRSAAGLSRADWVISEPIVDHAGHQVADQQVYRTCLSSFGATKDTFFHCVEAHGWLGSEVYQPAARYWTFQGIETAIFVALAVALLGLAAYWVRARLT